MTPNRIARLARTLIDRGQTAVHPDIGVGAVAVEAACRLLHFRHIRLPAIAPPSFRGLVTPDARRDIATREGMDDRATRFFLWTEVGCSLAGPRPSPLHPAYVFALRALLPVCPGGASSARDRRELYDVLISADPALADAIPTMDVALTILEEMGPLPPCGCVIRPEKPETPAQVAYVLGMQARCRGEYADAKVFFSRASEVAQATEEWEYLAAAELGQGKVFKYQGFTDAAAATLRSAAKIARKHRLRLIFARAMHDLSTLSIESAGGAPAYRRAWAALCTYPVNDADRIRLVHDIGFLWIEQGYFRRALSVLLAAAPHVTAPVDRMLVCSNVARAAGCDGAEQCAKEYARQAWALTEELPITFRTAQAYLNLAYGAHARGEWPEAWRAVNLAHTLASELGEGIAERQAEGLRHAIAGRMRVEYIPGRPQPDADRFARRVVAKLGGERVV